MAELAELTARLDQLRALRARGVRSTEYQGEKVEYRSDAEMATAIADLERQIAGSVRTPVRTIYLNACKGT